MPPTRPNWPTDIKIYGSSAFSMTSEPPVSFSSQNGKSYVDLSWESSRGNRVGQTVKADLLKSYVGQDSVSIVRLWSTGLWGLIYNKETEIYSAVKLFRVDLATSQDSLESRVPYMFWNNFNPKPYPNQGNLEWHFMSASRSPYVYKTSTEVREWIEAQKLLQDGFRGSTEKDELKQWWDAPAATPLPPSSDLTTQYFDLKVNDYLTLQIPVSSHPWANANWSSNFRNVLSEALRKKGFNTASINEILSDFYDDAVRAITGTSVTTNPPRINGGTTGSSGGVSAPTTLPVTSGGINIDPPTVVVRLPSGSQRVDVEEMYKLNQTTIKPHLRQAYSNSDGERVEDAFYFDYVPSTISYTLGGSSWNEIPRTYGDPLIEWQSYGLTRVQFTFLIAGQRLVNGGQSNSYVPDGLDVDIEDRIQLLRRMATRTSPVVVYGLDDIFNIQLQRAQFTGEPCSWAISDLAITAKRRTEGPPTLISVAQVNMSLIELPIEYSVAFKLKPLTLQVTTPSPSATSARNPIRPDLWTEYLSKPLENVLLIQT